MANEKLYYIGVKAVIRNGKGQFLVLHITRRSDNYIYYDLPGGRISSGEAAAETLAREVAEETGITELAVERHLMMILSGVQLPLEGERKAGIVFDIYLCSTNSSALKLEENMTAKWCTAAEAAKLLAENRDYPKSVIDAVSSL